MQEDINCCKEACPTKLNKNFWDNQYQNNETGWDLGSVSPPLKELIDKLEDKQLSILIPGAGNAYEAEYLIERGFTDVTVIDIAPTVVDSLKRKFTNSKRISIVQGDFFEHIGQYDLILEQTFFCALNPSFRKSYVGKMFSLLKQNGILTGLLFNRTFEKSPPFGGNKEEYEMLFQPYFDFLIFEPCKNSVAPRVGSELFFSFRKKL